MPPRKMPKAPLDADENAYDNLRTFFPRNEWKFSKEKDFFSDTEYGIDFYIEAITSDRELTGAKFLVQSKTFNTDARVKGKSLKEDFKVTTLNYFETLHYPVLIHFYDTINKVGYCVWFDEWASNESDYSNQTTKRIKISKNKHRLDASMVKRIRKKVLIFFQTQQLVRNALSETNKNKYYEFRPSLKPNGVDIAIVAKTPDAFEKQPIQFNLTADRLDEILKLLNDRGGVARFNAKLSEIRGLPSWFFQGADGEEFDVVVGTHLPDRIIPWELTYYNDKDEKIWRSFVQLRPTRYGAKYHKWRAIDDKLNIEYILEVDLEKQHLSMDFQFLPANFDAEMLLNRYQLLIAAQFMKKAIVRNLIEDMEFEVPARMRNVGAVKQVEEELPFLQAIVDVNNFYKSEIPVSEVEYSAGDVSIIYALQESIKLGRTSRLTIIPEPPEEKEIILKLGVDKNKLDVFLEEVKSDPFIETTEYDVNFHVVGQTITTRAMQVARITELLNRSDIENVPQDKEVVDLVFGYDAVESYLYFPNSPVNKDDESSP